eukprot:CAMPEP_0179963000 /NCGR_PEP_ID=MMETSP0983-20121128/30533_1 /TAXON_ID=483367 /ORGANISM="non described non described, Strain CCMP 2436" /LENGTH=84 /DNA_ID=CAMNT_0021875573 /DNA_START=77 /DNA_END=327 /DNA_ORIENTATION=-
MCSIGLTPAASRRLRISRFEGRGRSVECVPWPALQRALRARHVGERGEEKMETKGERICSRSGTCAHTAQRCVRSEEVHEESSG